MRNIKKYIKVLDFGSLNIDNTYRVDKIVKEGETIACNKFEKFIGGKGLNQAIALKKSGADVMFAGLVGNDDGDLLIDYIEKNNLTHMIKKTSGPSGHAIIQIDNCGQNSIIVEGGANKKIEKIYVDEVIKGFNKGDYILLQNEINDVDYIVNVASEKGLKVFLNPSPINEKIYDIDFNKVDCIILNESEGRSLSGKDNKLDIISYFKKKYHEMEVILTLGEEGGYYSHKETLMKYRANKVDVVDTTAAGDTFCGYFVGLQALDYRLEDSLDTASLAAAITCKTKGASSSIPTIDKLKKR